MYIICKHKIFTNVFSRRTMYFSPYFVKTESASINTGIALRVHFSFTMVERTRNR